MCLWTPSCRSSILTPSQPIHLCFLSYVCHTFTITHPSHSYLTTILLLDNQSNCEIPDYVIFCYFISFRYIQNHFNKLTPTCKFPLHLHIKIRSLERWKTCHKSRKHYQYVHINFIWKLVYSIMNTISWYEKVFCTRVPAEVCWWQTDRSAALLPPE
jgi:hypothetical protein